MIPSDADVRVSYACNGSLSIFPFSFPLIESSDIKVTLRNKTTYVSTVLTETTDYTVKDVNGVEGVDADFSDGGTITTTIVVPYNSNYTLTLERNVPYTQNRDFIEGSPTLYENFESSLDKLTMEIQQLKDRINRSITVPSVDSASLSMEMPSAEDRADKYLLFNSEGEPTTVEIMSTSDTPVSAYGKTLIVATDASNARDILDVASAISSAISLTIPAGFLGRWPTETPPTGWLTRNGASLVITEHPGLYAVIGKMFGSADDEHFNLPNDLGIFERNWANGDSRDPDRATRTAPTATGATISAGDHVGTEQAEATKAHNHTASASSSTSVVAGGSHAHNITLYTLYGAGTSGLVGTGTSGYGGGTGATAEGGSHTHTASTTTTVTVNNSSGNETRPINRAYLPIIKDG